MKRWRLGLAYDGAEFCGWGVQPDQRSVQKTLEECARKVFGDVGEVTAAGRTDAGVHARGQTVHLDLEGAVDREDVFKRLMAVLPEDLALTKVSEVAADFHARYSCLAKEYIYRIANERARPVLDRNLVHWQPRPLALVAMRKASAYFEGQLDFAAMMNSGGAVESTVRRIYRLRVRRRHGIVEIAVLGEGFLYNQVRIIAGTLMEVGLGRRLPESMPEILASQSRQEAGETLPAKGLTLETTIYQGDKAEGRLPSQE